MNQIQICGTCEGFGLVEVDIGAHKSDYKEQVCAACGGSGRIVVMISIVKQPFIPEPGKSKRIF